MPQTVNLVESGLPSAIYLLTFPEPITGYKIDKKLKLGSRTTKIYEWINGTNRKKGLIANGYISKSESVNGYIAEVKPIIWDLEKEIKISKNDRNTLTNILNSKEFRAFVKRKIIPNIEFPSDIRSFYGFDELLEQISLISGIVLALKVLKNDLPDDMTIEDITEDIIYILPEDDKYYFSNNFHLLSDKLLQEIAELHESSIWTHQILITSWNSVAFGAYIAIEICRRLFIDNEEVQRELNNTDKIIEIRKEIWNEIRDQFKNKDQ